MAFQEHKVASGFNNAAGYVNLEDYFGAPFYGDRLPEGAVVSDAADRTRVYDGDQRVFLRTSGCTFAQLTAFVNAVFTSWAGTPTKEVTFRCQTRANVYDDFNAIVYKPVAGTHFRHVPIDMAEEIQLEFLIIAEATP